MFNHNRGLWGYSGAYTGDGEPLTIQATGLGGPSAAIVLEELAALGLERAIRVGTAAALDATLAPGDLLIVERALCGDGTSAALGALGEVEADPVLLAELRRGAGLAGSSGARALTSGTVVSSDLFYESAHRADRGLARTRGAARSSSRLRRCSRSAPGAASPSPPSSRSAAPLAGRRADRSERAA